MLKENKTIYTEKGVISEEGKKYILDVLDSLIPDLNNKHLFIVGIGTIKAKFDDVGPMIGSFLIEKLKDYNNIKVIGTLDNNCMALNINDKTEIIDEYESKYGKDKVFTIAIDACASGGHDLGKIVIRERPVKPGYALGKELKHIGDISVIVCTISDLLNPIYYSSSCETNLKPSYQDEISFQLSELIATAVTKKL